MFPKNGCNASVKNDRTAGQTEAGNGHHPNTLHHQIAKDWRNWLKKNYKTEKEIWLVYPKKATGKPRIEYNDAVEEALCFGWIDSINKRLDDDHTVQRFSPRKPKAKYSQANIERLRYLVAKKKVIKEVAETLDDVLNEEFVIPDLIF